MFPPSRLEQSENTFERSEFKIILILKRKQAELFIRLGKSDVSIESR